MELEGYQITAVHKSYSDVFFAKDEKTDENVVIKRFKERRGTLFDCVREMMFHQVLSSKYIVKMKVIQLHEGDLFYLIFQKYRTLSSVCRSVCSDDKLKSQYMNRRCDIAQQCVDGVRYLHGRGLVHSDLTWENIYLDGKWNVKIGDFSNSFFMDYDPNILTTGLFRPPEGIKGIKWFCELTDKKTDLWGLGVVLTLVMMDLDDVEKELKILFGNLNENSLLKLTLYVPKLAEKRISHTGWKRIVRNLLHLDRNKRKLPGIKNVNRIPAPDFTDEEKEMLDTSIDVWVFSSHAVVNAILMMRTKPGLPVFDDGTSNRNITFLLLVYMYNAIIMYTEKFPDEDDSGSELYARYKEPNRMVPDVYSVIAFYGKLKYWHIDIQSAHKKLQPFLKKDSI